MKLRVLGSSGAEFPGYRLPAFLIDGKLLMDAGTIGSALSSSEQWKIKHVLLTHTHLDHVRGLPFLADNIIITGKKYRVDVYSIPPVLKSFKKNVLNWVVWPDFTTIPAPEKGVLRLNPVRVGRKFIVNGYTVSAYRVAHTVPAVGYIVEDKRGNKVLYTGDTGPTERLWKAIDSTLCCAIIEVSFPNSMTELSVQTGHLTPKLLRAEIEKMKVVPDRILCTHPKPQHRATIKKELRALGMKNIHMISDGEEYDI